MESLTLKDMADAAIQLILFMKSQIKYLDSETAFWLGIVTMAAVNYGIRKMGSILQALIGDVLIWYLVVSSWVIQRLLKVFMMVTLPVNCPCCKTHDVIKAGKQPNGTQRYRCRDVDCQRTIFQLDYRDKGRLPAIKRQVVEMAMNGSGIRDTARALSISTDTVINELKKSGLRLSRSTGLSSTRLMRRTRR